MYATDVGIDNFYLTNILFSSWKAYLFLLAYSPFPGPEMGKWARIGQ
jgi:hypothetical protein